MISYSFPLESLPLPIDELFSRLDLFVVFSFFVVEFEFYVFQKFLSKVLIPQSRGRLMKMLRQVTNDSNIEIAVGHPKIIFKKLI